MTLKRKTEEACKALKPLGISKAKITKKLKELLELYDNKWELIEDEGYRVLVDAIMEKPEETQELKSKEKASPHLKSQASEPQPKRFCTRYQKRKASNIQCSSASSASVPDSHRQVAYQISAGLSSKSESDSSESEDFEVPLKRLCRKGQTEQVPISVDTSQSKLAIAPVRKGLLNEVEFSKSCYHEVLEPIQFHFGDEKTNWECVPLSNYHTYKRRKADLYQSCGSPVLLPASPKTSTGCSASSNVLLSMNLAHSENVLDLYHNSSLDMGTDRRFRDDQSDEVPISVIHPDLPQLLYEDGASNENDSNAKANGLNSMDTKSEDVEDKDLPQLLCDDDSTRQNNVTAEADGYKSMEVKFLDMEDQGGSCLNSHFDVASSPVGEVNLDLPQLSWEDGFSDKNNVNSKADGLKSMDTKSIDLEMLCEDDSSEKNSLIAKATERKSVDLEVKGDRCMNPQFIVASSSKGEVILCLICDASLQSNFSVPNVDEVLKVVEDEWRKSYRIMEPEFSLRKAMKNLCERFLEMGAASTNVEQTLPSPKLVSPNVCDAMEFPGGEDACQLNFLISPDGSVKFQNLFEVKSQIPKPIALNWFDNLYSIIGLKKLKVLEVSESQSCSKQAGQKHQLFLDLVKPYAYIDDITRGKERVKVSFVKGWKGEDLPHFGYIAQNAVYDKASVKFTFACISDEDCCSQCMGDCLTSVIPCACAREPGGEFAYTPKGLVKEKILKEYICICSYEDPKKDSYFFCQSCPLERLKNNASSCCKGHLMRKFIKECWSKCGCSKNCGNRVVQRGIRRNLQVFWTPEGKGWGLQAAESLQRGAFVCEYIGEILTASELCERNLGSTNKQKDVRAVILDAAWGSKNVLKDEEALCLDATSYSNIARFINHRCSDANLIEIPVEVETPNRCYYRLGLFTKREVAAMEELTWDYGIDFKDPVKPFDCLCGSSICRDLKH